MIINGYEMKWSTMEKYLEKLNLEIEDCHALAIIGSSGGVIADKESAEAIFEEKNSIALQQFLDE